MGRPFPYCQPEAPNVFTPNADGMNDQFFARLGCTPVSFHLLVTNRWGRLVFETSDPTQQWDGQLNGQPVANGTYFYEVLLSGPNRQQELEDFVLRGTVMVIR